MMFSSTLAWLEPRPGRTFAGRDGQRKLASLCRCGSSVSSRAAQNGFTFRAKALRIGVGTIEGGAARGAHCKFVIGHLRKLNYMTLDGTV